MDTFDQAVKEAEARHASPVAEAKKTLAAPRAEAEKWFREFESLAARYRPVFNAAQSKFLQAAALGGASLPA